MSGSTTPAEGTTAPATTTPATPAPAPAATPPAAAPPPPEKPRVMASDLPDDALKKRIDDAKRSEREAVYRELGKSPEEIKALVDAEQARAEAQKTLEQKNAEQAQQLEQAKRYREAVEAQIAAATPTLSDEQRAVLEIISDPADKLKAIAKMKPFSVTTVPEPAASGSSPEPPAPTPPRGDSAPSPSAPGDGSPTSPPDHRKIYEDLKQRNPIAAADYASLHKDAVWGGMIR